ncbi:MAG: Gfo/Idh/MocA family oxidoreductase [Candidatus Kuenenbacteria bacterium]
MNKNIKILIIGFGSIGQRHYHNLKKLGYKNLWLYDLNKKIVKSYPNIVDKLTVNKLKEFDMIFICSPNNLHIKHALLAAKAGCHLFIEKPLSHNLKDIDQLEKIIKSKKLINMVACNMRFHPCLQFIKKYLDKKKLGKIYSIHHEFGYYLPYWRLGTDYTKNYAAQRAMGGGIILDDIHEFDLLFWLNHFEKIIESKFIYGKLSNLKTDTEDSCIAAFKFKNKVLGSVKCDYLQKKESRACKIIGENGNIMIDLLKNTVILENENTCKKLFSLKRKNDDADYIHQLKYFMNCLQRKQKTFNDTNIANQVLKYCVQKK